jgi:hypothetical protein
VSFAERFEETVSSRGENSRTPRQSVVSHIEDLLSSEYNIDSKGRFTARSVYKLYLDLCMELNKEPEIVYTGHGVRTLSEVETIAEKKGVPKEQVLNDLEVTV